MINEIVEISGCRDCIFLNLDSWSNTYCTNFKRKSKLLNLVKLLDPNEKPKWCPLKNKILTIKLK